MTGYKFRMQKKKYFFQYTGSLISREILKEESLYLKKKTHMLLFKDWVP